MPVTWKIDEAFTTDLSDNADSSTLEMGWTLWAEDGGARVAAEADEARDALILAHGVEIGATHPTFTSHVCTERRITRRSDVEIFDATARFVFQATEPPADDFNEFMQQSKSDSPGNPHGPQYGGSTQVIEEFLPNDLDGEVLETSAGEPLADPLPIMVPLQVRRVTVNQRDEPDLSQVGIADGKNLMTGISFEQKYHVNKKTGTRTRYFSASYEVTQHPYRDWNPTFVLDAGYKERLPLHGGAPGETALVSIKQKGDGVDKDEPLTSISFLDGKGRVLRSGQPRVFRPFRFHRTGQIGPFF